MDELKRLLKDIVQKSSDADAYVQLLIEKVKNGEINMDKGLSFLAVKNDTFLSYCADLVQLMCLKITGQSIENSLSVDRLVEYRTVLEKMRPIGQKLQYQLDKLVKTATVGFSSIDDPLTYKPNPDNVDSKFDIEGEASEAGSDDDKKATSSKASTTYRPPKLMSVPYEDGESKREREVKRLRERLVNRSDYFDDVIKDNDERPTEIRDDFSMHRAKVSHKEQERTAHEEEYFMRFQVSKKERHASKRLMTMSTLNDVTKFSNLSALTGNDEQERPKKKRKKTVMSTKGKKSGGKKKGGSKKRKFRH